MSADCEKAKSKQSQKDEDNWPSACMAGYVSCASVCECVRVCVFVCVCYVVCYSQSCSQCSLSDTTPIKQFSVRLYSLLVLFAQSTMWSLSSVTSQLRIAATDFSLARNALDEFPTIRHRSRGVCGLSPPYRVSTVLSTRLVSNSGRTFYIYGKKANSNHPNRGIIGDWVFISVNRCSE